MRRPVQAGTQPSSRGQGRCRRRARTRPSAPAGGAEAVAGPPSRLCLRRERRTASASTRRVAHSGPSHVPGVLAVGRSGQRLSPTPCLARVALGLCCLEPSTFKSIKARTCGFLVEDLPRPGSLCRWAGRVCCGQGWPDRWGRRGQGAAAALASRWTGFAPSTCRSGAEPVGWSEPQSTMHPKSCGSHLQKDLQPSFNIVLGVGPCRLSATLPPSSQERKRERASVRWPSSRCETRGPGAGTLLSSVGTVAGQRPRWSSEEGSSAGPGRGTEGSPAGARRDRPSGPVCLSLPPRRAQVWGRPRREPSVRVLHLPGGDRGSGQAQAGRDRHLHQGACSRGWRGGAGLPASAGDAGP